MKNYGTIVLRTFLTTLFLFGFAGCEPKKEDKKTETPIDPPKQIVTVKQAKGYYDNYSKRRAPLIQRYEDSINRRRMGDTIPRMQQQEKGKAKSATMVEAPAKFDVARYVYYDYKTIKQYIEFIDQQAAAAKVDISTLRFYFSNYPDSTQYVHPRQNSIMISPALHKDKREYLFYIDDSDPKNPRPVLLTDSFKPSKVQIGAISKEEQKAYASMMPSFSTPNATVVYPYNGGQSLTMNKGTGVPPPDHE